MKALCLFVLLLATTTIHAQAACPPGTIPYGAGNDPSACGPDDSQQPQEPQTPRLPRQIWVDRWGAMATNEPGDVLGVATNMQSESEAKRSAILDCQTKGREPSCTSLVSYRNGCAVLLVGDKFFNASSAATIEEATQSGMKVCSANGNANCHVYYSACSLPVRIQ
ncbi:lipoprotein [Rhodanobacter fulvus Jip2]|uniref:Lipoprotein n=2 Tax=Rhodanobacter TaxID=75309 RepID=I4VXM7_9GAMM|nr:lipoprotein [Rhodanobacter fulvus Jip2]